ncbi:alpha/beta hydrolase family protein [Pseudodesulfovibrio methanolicus]|uniref:Alpha/beta hydrolase family protein n=1 Tax=Pseudodesulfovibrio methanolicus TaxID=3126690 RepID=A0ABZ2J1G3_9BACT
MQRALSWTLSILFHAVVAVALLNSVSLPPLLPEELMEVNLTEVPEPQPIIPMPAPAPAPEPQAAKECPEVPPAAAPLPMDKTVVLDDAPQPPETAPPPEAEPAPPAEPDVVEISPSKTLPPEPEPAPEEELAEDGLPKKIYVRKDGTVHRGAEARFGRAMMGDYFSYSPQEFSGQFRTKDNRVISIIDARNTKYGRFLIYDSKNKTLRRLKQAFGKYVYTVGPSVYADEPVTGSVTFLAKDDRIERFILVTDDDRIAHYPVKVHVREEAVAFDGPAGRVEAMFSRPPYDEGHAGVVVVHGPECADPGMVQAFTRTLSMHGLAALTFVPRGCGAETPAPAGTGELAEDTASAFDFLAAHPSIGADKAGIWGSGRGVPAAIRAAGLTSPRFLVCMLTDGLAPTDMPNRTVLAGLDLPVLWLITGRETAKWRPLITVLEALRDKQQRPFTIVVAPAKTSREVLEAEGARSSWVEQVADDHASLAVSWINGLK